MAVNVQGERRIAQITAWHLFLFAFALRLLWAWFIPIHPLSDSSIYDVLAQRLASGHGYSWPDGRDTAYWPVGTSALYGLIYASFGRNLFIVAIVNAVMGAMLVAATFALARTRFNHDLSLLAGFFVAIWPTWISLTSIISSELPTNLFFVAGVACALSRRGPSWGRTILSSALIAGSAYFRANMLPFIILVPLLVAIRDHRPLHFLVQGGLAVLVAALLIGPWAMRNQHSFGKAVPISTNFGVNLWIGNNPQADGGFMAPPPPGRNSLPKNEVAQDRLYQEYAKDYIYTHPVKYVQLCFRRLVIALDRETYGVAWNDQGLPNAAKTPLKIIMTGYWYLLFLLSLCGLALFLWRQPSNILSPFVILPAAIMAAPVLIMSSERYHYAIAPFVAIFAAYALVRLHARRRGDCGSRDMPSPNQVN